MRKETREELQPRSQILVESLPRPTSWPGNRNNFKLNQIFKVNQTQTSNLKKSWKFHKCIGIRFPGNLPKRMKRFSHSLFSETKELSIFFLDSW